MSTFKISKRSTYVVNANLKAEAHGNERVPHVDLKLRVGLTRKDFPMICPMAEGDKKNSMLDRFYSEKGDLIAPYMRSFPIERKPEGLLVKFYEGKEVIVFEGGRVTGSGMTLTLEPGWRVMLEFSVRVPVATKGSKADANKIASSLQQDRQISVVSSTKDLWDDEEDDDEDDAGEQMDIEEEDEE